MKPNARGTVRERMERYTIPEPMSGCHLWIGAIQGNGYGSINVDGGMRRAHRVAWTLAKGEIPAGGQVLHKCDNPPCVNVDHLYIGDYAANISDRVVRGRRHYVKKTHCPRGHEYTATNTYTYKRRAVRRCRICAAVWDRAAYVARGKHPGKETQV